MEGHWHICGTGEGPLHNCLPLLTATMNRLSLSPLLVFALLGHGTCSMVNRTIDDKYGDEVTGQVPLYTPSKGWAEGSNCNGCGISVSGGVDPHGPFNGTWHDTTVHPHDPSHTIALNFTGSAVYVFNMIANRVNHVSTETHITFFIDDEKVGQYDHTSDNTTEFHYQVPVYTNISMPYKEHSLKIVADGTQLSLVLFDYVKYTTKADNISVASAVTSSLDSPTTVRTSLSQTTISSSTSPHPATTRTSTSSYPTTDTIVTYTGPPDLSSQTSVPSPTPLQRGDSKHLATVAGLTAALSFLCGMAALGIFRTRKSIMLCLRRARGRGRGSQGHTRVYPAGSSSSSAQSSLDVNFSNSRSTLIRLGSPASPSSISYVPSTPQYTFLREPPPVRQYRGGPVTYPDVPTRHRSSPPTHSVDVPRSAVSSSRTGTDQSSGSISELRRELRSLREKLRELQSPRKHRLRLADGHSAGPGRGSSEVGVPVSLETLQEDV